MAASKCWQKVDVEQLGKKKRGGGKGKAGKAFNSHLHDGRLRRAEREKAPVPGMRGLMPSPDG